MITSISKRLWPVAMALTLTACSHRGKNIEQINAMRPKTIVYESIDGETLRVRYNMALETVTLLLPDKTITLPLAISASGARYAADHAVFWNKGTNAFYWLNDTLRFEGYEISMAPAPL